MDDQSLSDDAFAPSRRPAWVLREHGYDRTLGGRHRARFAISNGLLGVRASRAVAAAPMWISWQHTLSWASWPRTYVAGLFDTPNTEPPVPALVPAPDWLRLRIVIDGEPLLLRSGELLRHWRTSTCAAACSARSGTSATGRAAATAPHAAPGLARRARARAAGHGALRRWPRPPR